MCITGPSAGENSWTEVDGESRTAAGFPYPIGLSGFGIAELVVR